MQKPHEETWTATPDAVECGPDDYARFDGPYEMAAARARLAAQAPAMARILLEIASLSEGVGDVRSALGDETCEEIRSVLRAAGVLP